MTFNILHLFYHLVLQRQLVNKSINDAWDKASDSVKQAYGRSCIDELLKVRTCVSTCST